MSTINKNKKLRLALRLAGVFFTACLFLVTPLLLIAQEDTNQSETSETIQPADNSQDGSLNDLNQEIDERRQRLEELREKQKVYEESVKAKQQEAITLQSQMGIIDLQVEQTSNDIERVTTEKEKVNLEIDKLQLDIDETETELAYTKEVLAEYIRLLYKYDQKNYLEILLMHDSFSDFFDQLQYTEDLENNVKNALLEIKEVKTQLESDYQAQEQKREELEALSEQLSTSILNLESQKEYKEDLLENTKESEERFQILLEEAKREQESAQTEIRSLESQAREKLEEEGIELDVSAALMWPVSPVKGISAYFHDPDYPYRWLFEHPAIDIPAAQGTAIRAAENGYVVRAKNAGMGYSYIMLVHNDDLSTVYGHVSRIDVVEDDYVVRGQVVGAVGGTPGTPGAGRLTTGPHLHFEVRSGGIPVNPLDYLPSL